MAEGTGVKKEFRIDSTDSAKPPVTMQDEPRYFSDIKPKKRTLSDVVYEDTGEVERTRKGEPIKLILKTSIYDDGTLVTTTVGEQNDQYQEFLRTGVAMASKSNEPTLVRPASDAVKKALAKVNKPAAKKSADKE